MLFFVHDIIIRHRLGLGVNHSFFSRIRLGNKTYDYLNYFTSKSLNNGNNKVGVIPQRLDIHQAFCLTGNTNHSKGPCLSNLKRIWYDFPSMHGNQPNSGLPWLSNSHWKTAPRISTYTPPEITICHDQRISVIDRKWSCLTVYPVLGQISVVSDHQHFSLSLPMSCWPQQRRNETWQPCLSTWRLKTCKTCVPRG